MVNFYPQVDGKASYNYGSQTNQSGFRSKGSTCPQGGACLIYLHEYAGWSGTADCKTEDIALEEIPGDMDSDWNRQFTCQQEPQS